MNSKEKFYPESLFGGFTDIDGTIAFFNRVNSLIKPDSIVLDVGCGRGEYEQDPLPLRRNLRILKGKVGKVIGIDVDTAGEENPFIDEFHLITNNLWPVESDSVDLIVCDNVVEHISDPNELFFEIRRVLKNNGYLCIRTTNRLSYVGLAASIIPNNLHSKVTSVVQEGRKEEDVFPTVYKCNSIFKLKNIMKKNGFTSVVYGFEAEPAYFAFSKIAYFLAVLHQKFAPNYIKTILFGFGKIKK